MVERGPDPADVGAQWNSKGHDMNLSIGNLSREVTEADLRDCFSPFGELKSVTIVKNKFSGVSRGFAFIEMPVQEEAEAAVAALHRKLLKGESMDITEARPKPPKRHGSGGRRPSW